MKNLREVCVLCYHFEVHYLLHFELESHLLQIELEHLVHFLLRLTQRLCYSKQAFRTEVRIYC